MNFEDIVKDNAKLIYKIAYKYSGYYEIEDLFQVGVIGLKKAYNNYNTESNSKFSTYAFKYILGEIISYIKNDRTIKVGSDTLKLYKAYEKSREFLTNKFGRYPSLEEVCNFMNVSQIEVIDAIEKSEFVVSLDAVLTEDDFTLEQVAGVDSREQIDNLIDLRTELENLPEQERKLIELRYFEDYTQSETADYLDMTQVQVSRYEQKILKKIRTKIAA